jgi:hypothetical protein
VSTKNRWTLQAKRPPRGQEGEIHTLTPIVFVALILGTAILIWHPMRKSGSSRTGDDVVYVNNSAFRALKANLCQFDETAYRGTLVTADNFPRKSPAINMGRFIGQFDVDAATTSPVAVVSDRLFWQSCGSEIRILGNSLLIDGHPHTIVGVLARGVVQDSQGNEVDLWFTESTR